MSSHRILPQLPSLLALLCLPGLALGAQDSGGWPDLARARGSIPDASKDSAIIVGIENHPGLPEVTGAAGIAAAWASFFDQGGIPQDRIVLLQNEAATAQALGLAVVGLGVQMEQEGTLWLVFVGHGIPPQEKRDGLLVTWDSDPLASELYRRGKPVSSLLQDLDAGGHQRAIIFLDTGFFKQDGSPAVRADDLPLRATATPVVADPRNALLLGTDANTPARLLPGHDQPAFSYLALGALRGWADLDDDGRVNLLEAMGWILDTARTFQLPQPPTWFGEPSNLVLSKAKEKQPDLDAILLVHAEPRYQLRLRNLGARESEALANARKDWLALGSWSPDPENRAIMGSFLDKYQDVRLSEEGMSRWVVIPEVDQARLLHGGGDEPQDSALDPLIEQKHVQITEEMRTLSRRNAWKGVDARFLDLVALFPQGVKPLFEDCLHGAEAARALGDVTAVRDRLFMAISVSPSTEAKEWINEIEKSYGRVRIHDNPRRPQTLKASKTPFAPDQRSAIEFAVRALAETGQYEGWLPWGVYHLGKRTFVVVPGDPTIEVSVR